MDQNFNDEELANIMSEIEDLEKEFEDVEDEKPQIDNYVQESESEHPQHLEPVAEQTEFVDAKPTEVTPEPENQNDSIEVVHEQPVAEHNEILEELSQMPVEEVQHTGHVEHVEEANVHHMKTQDKEDKHFSNSPKTSMSFNVQGDMKLDLNFTIGDRDVQLYVSEEGLEIEMAGGAKFILPATDFHAGKKAA